MRRGFGADGTRPARAGARAQHYRRSDRRAGAPRRAVPARFPDSARYGHAGRPALYAEQRRRAGRRRRSRVRCGGRPAKARCADRQCTRRSGIRGGTGRPRSDGGNPQSTEGCSRRCRRGRSRHRDGANAAAGALDDVDTGRAAADSTRATAIEGLTRTPDENPYAPLGLRLGTFIVTPTLEQGIGWTSNANLSPDGEGSTFSETALRLNAISDWSRHSATIDADVSYRKSLSGQEISEVEGGVAGQLRLDLADQWSAFVGGGYRVRPESASSPETIEDAVSRPTRHTFTGNAGVERDLGPLRLQLAGDVIRETYGDAELSGGGTLPQDDRDTTLALVRMRAGYELSPALRPFVEAEIGRRSYDEEFDRNGYQRSADRYGVRAGVEVDIQEKLRGEISAGWVSENPEDERLPTMSGLSLAANLAWSPVRGTTVALDASTEVEGSTIAGKTGSLYHSASLSVSRELRQNLTGSVLAGIGWRDYFGHDESDLVLRGEASLTWWLNRYAGITGRASHEIQRGTLPDRDYDETRVYLGMTFQR
ncbi:outer membrane beta-barrel protein [Mesorhizobium sediminum]|nr:outer membrane beta-barrel protein [Mesorhizobium sediminum]